jgi:hypothetical protein
MPPIAKPWFRMYSDILDNEKIDHLRVPLVKVWLKLLALANVNKPRGRLPELKRIAYRLRVSQSAAAAFLAELKAAELVDREGLLWVMHDWDDWQKDSDLRLSSGRQGADELRYKENGEWVNPPLKRRVSAADAPHNGGGSAADTRRRVEGDKEEDKERDREVEEETPPRRNIFVLYDQYMGRPSITAMIRPALLQAEEDNSDECVTHCFEEAAKSSDGRRSWSYVAAILKRHQAEGCHGLKPRANAGQSRPTAGANGQSRTDRAAAQFAGR